jgi:predicted aspartyl protease
MLKPLRPRATLFLLSGMLVAVSAACFDSATVKSIPPEPSPSIAASPTSPSPASSPGSSSAAQSTNSAQPDPYQLAIERASSAFTIGQSAQSRDDWRLVASRWQQAIGLLESVPASNPNHAQAQGKLAEYRRNLAYAQRQASQPTAPESNGIVAIAPRSESSQNRATSNFPEESSEPRNNRVFQAPIVRRAGGTPVISVLFNGNQYYNMIVDTGASGTVITPQMAIALGVVPVGQAQVDTASARAVSFPLGYVRSIQVDGAVARNVLVAVAGSELEIGLLGHDFFGNYDVTVRENVVEFRER